jgi:endonuclease YncB( thermonuclease family)
LILGIFPSFGRTDRFLGHSRHRWGYDPRLSVRLVGFNAPETRRAACEAERELGARATRRLRDLVRAGDLDFVYVTCSCPLARRARKERRRAITAEIAER